MTPKKKKKQCDITLKDQVEYSFWCFPSPLSILSRAEWLSPNVKKTRGRYKPLSGHSGEEEERCGRSRDGRGRVKEGVRFLEPCGYSAAAAAAAACALFLGIRT